MILTFVELVSEKRCRAATIKKARVALIIQEQSPIVSIKLI